MAAGEAPASRRYLVLGPVEAHLDGRLLPVASGKQTLLLAALLARPGQVVPVDTLVDTLWGQRPPGAAGTLRALVSKLRRTLTGGHGGDGAAAEDLLVAGAGGYRLSLSVRDARGDDQEALDARGFASLLAQARAARAAGNAAVAVEAYRPALGLWRGPAFAGATGGAGVGALVTGEARRLDTERAAAVEEWLAAELDLGRHAQMLPELEALATAEPLNERPHEMLMVALYRAGRQQDALTVYRRLRALLAEELGVDPSAGVRTLHERLLRQDPALDRVAPDGPPRPAATSKVAGSSAPAWSEPVPARAAGGDAEAGAASAGPPSVGNLPVVADGLIGRDALLAQIRHLLGVSRVVTLTGTGGVGKTRLAVSAAATAARAASEDGRGAEASFPEGAWWAELAAVNAGRSVAEAVSTSLGVQQRQGLTVLERLVEYLGSRRLLLVLDNCEHVIEAVAELVEAVRRGCPHIVVLATSREPLRVDGEQVRPVPPLAVPSPSSVEACGVRRAAAVALFVTRAQAAAPGFALTDGNAAAVAQICRRLDGVPLALELAATRMPSMTPGEVANRLERRFRLLRSGQRTAATRHRSLQAAIDWSYALLDDDERQAFNRLSVFAGGFTLQAAERIVASSDARTGGPDQPPGRLLEEAEVAGVLAGLVDKSMVVAAPDDGSTRYSLLETLRTYGREWLATHGEETAQRAHATYLTAFVDTAAEHLDRPEGPKFAEAIARELDDLRAAHAWSLEHELHMAIRLVAGLFRYVEHRMPPEVPLWAERTVEAAELAPAGTHPPLPTVYAVAARGAARRGDLDRAKVLAERGAAGVGADDPACRHPLYALGAVALFEGRLEDADRLTAEVERLARATGDAWFAVRALVIRGLARVYAGDAEAALALAENARALADRSGDPAATGWSRYITGEALLETDPERAAKLLGEALTVARAIDDRYLTGVAMVSATSVRARHGDPRQAAWLFRDVVDHWHAVGNWTQQWTTLRNVVELLVRTGIDEPAAVLLGALEVRGTASPAFGLAAARLAAALRELEDRLGPEAAALAIDRGAAMGDDQALHFARNALGRMTQQATATR